LLLGGADKHKSSFQIFCFKFFFSLQYHRNVSIYKEVNECGGCELQLVREAVGMHVTVPYALMRDVAEAASGAGVISDPSLVTNAVAGLRPHLTVGGNK
jgi:hypothetical protein